MTRLVSKSLSGLIVGLMLIVPAIGHSQNVTELIEPTGITHGVCAVPDCGDGVLAIRIASDTRLLVHAFDSRPDAYAASLQARQRARLDSNRVVIEQLDSDPLPYVDRFVDLLVLREATSTVPAREAARVIRPRGWALVPEGSSIASALEQLGFDIVGSQQHWKLLRKAPMAEVDDWSHWYHAPDNNPISTDAVIQAPFLTQWLGMPYYHAMPVVTTVADGRVFVASGHIAHHDRENQTINTLVARNGYNGRELWRRTLPTGYLVHRSAFIATADKFYMMEGDDVVCLDPETGAEIDRIKFPGLQGTLVWIAKIGQTLYALSSQQDPPTEMLRVGSQGRGWGWDQVDRNYSPDGAHQIRWGFGETLVALDLDDRQVLWRHEQPNIDSRGLGILRDSLFYYVPGKKLACLDRHTGEMRWVNEDTEKLSIIEKEAQGLQGTPGFRTSAMLLATPVGLFMQGQKRAYVAGFSIEDGKFLWSKPKFQNNPNMVFVNGKLLISGIERNGAVQVIDPATGDTLENLNFWKGSCARLTGSPDGLYCRGEGLGRYDFQTRKYTAERTARPGCNDGAIPANGLLYVGPWLCDCNLSMLGQMVLGPAGDFDAHGQHVTNEHLQRRAELPAGEPLSASAEDWPEYRANHSRTASSTASVPLLSEIVWKSDAIAPPALQTQPVAVGGYVFAAGDDGVVQCFESGTGKRLWQFATGGPILASPTCWQGRLFVGSGDGYVYCLAAEQGELLWRFRVAPREKRIMVYGRLGSIWPVNSGVLVHDGVAYAAAGIMFRDGTHVVALDARTGQLLWHNGTTGKPINDQFELQAASALGTLAVARDRLWLASGNVVAPTSFDLKTGEAQVMPAQRIPEWNTVMAQKPEPTGKDLLVFADKFLVHGGRLLYSGEGPVVSASQYSFRSLAADGRQLSPAFTPVRYCAVAPAWDAETFVMPTSQYGNVLGWTTSDVEKRLLAGLEVMIRMDKDIPGETPQKWGQYNLIGRVFGAVERQLRATSQWPVVRRQVFALAVARNAVLMTTRGLNPAGPCYVIAMEKASGREMWRVELPAEPRLGSLSVNRDGHVLVSLIDGSIVCIGSG